MNWTTLAPPLISAVATLVVTVIGLIATGRARKAERAANDQRVEADRLRREQDAMDMRSNNMIDQLQEDNTRLRSYVREQDEVIRALESRLRRAGGDG